MHNFLGSSILRDAFPNDLSFHVPFRKVLAKHHSLAPDDEQEEVVVHLISFWNRTCRFERAGLCLLPFLRRWTARDQLVQLKRVQTYHV